MKEIKWMKPQEKKRHFSSAPRITVSVKLHRSGETKKVMPYWRFSSNPMFMEAYYPGKPGVRRISIYVDEEVMLIDTKPTAEQYCYMFTQGGYFTDQMLIEKLVEHCGITLNPEVITNFHLEIKPYDDHESPSVYEMVCLEKTKEEEK
jgi:hypothetical protein